MKASNPGPTVATPTKPRAQRDQQTTGSEPDEPCGRNGGAQRAAVQFVECMGRDTDGKEEREHRRGEAPAVGARRKRRADDDVREVPRRVRRVQHRPPIAPAAGRAA